MKRKISKTDKKEAEEYRQRGLEWTARYIEMFGRKYLTSMFWDEPDGKAENEFYKEYVKKGEPFIEPEDVDY